ncbi:coiled-coil domain-containing protein [Actinomadura macrotermitis]|uniref:Uncharacterized protein n=1 Tax=Actinomadura macrotermitis TaxID=2585200 RepID=A0A7K0BP86_9ACTN|nr:hypothetical protein [Actinomadura macrotermitis]MQY02981.1 hypothetical protein [Actinomadura macrotermitis]
MTTVVLVVMCVAVGALELYAAKQSKDQQRAFVRRVDELNDQVTKQNNVLVTVGEQLTAELSKVKREVLPALDSRLRASTGQVEELAGVVHRADEFVRAQSARLHELEQQRITLAALRRKLGEVETSVRSVAAAGSGEVEGKVETALERLAELERGGTEILELQRTLTRTLEDVEDVVTELLRYTEGELDGAVATALTGRDDGAAVTATGRLWTRDEQLAGILAEVYERSVRASRLTVRFRTAEGTDGQGERRRYFLGGYRTEDLAGSFTALLISTGADLPRNGHRGGLARDPGGLPAGVAATGVPEDEAALKALLRTLYESTGSVAQIGPLLAVRTRDELLCAVLTPDQSLELESDEVFWDPADASLRLRRLPSHQLWDLTAWGATP